MSTETMEAISPFIFSTLPAAILIATIIAVHAIWQGLDFSDAHEFVKDSTSNTDAGTDPRTVGTDASTDAERKPSWSR